MSDSWLLILDGNEEHVAHMQRKLFERNVSNLMTVSM